MEPTMSPTTSIRTSGLLGIALLGAVGGAINASLCYAEFPVAAGGEHFKWHVIPAGAMHGPMLAALTVAWASCPLAKAVWAPLLAPPFTASPIAYPSPIPLTRPPFHAPAST